MDNSNPKTIYPILMALFMAHFINDLLQIVLQTGFPQFKEDYHLSYLQIGMITLVFQLSSSIFQPLVGNYTDKHPMPFSFMIGMSFTFFGIILLAYSYNYHMILLSAGLIGIGSSIFHPEASKLAFYVAGGKRGLAQSIFQIGGNAGTALGPLLFILFVIPNGQEYIVFFSGLAIVGIFIMGYQFKSLKLLNSCNSE
ncbi:MAG: MFS transporter, partial [Brumimicrobium sp.]|nr:MFS transporter [Brumimicrobium sp.]